MKQKKKVQKINKDKQSIHFREEQKKHKRTEWKNYSQASFPSKDDRAIPNAWTAHKGYLKSHVKISKLFN